MITSILRLLFTKSKEPLYFTNKVVTPNIKSKDFGLYIHIPFCKTLCPFCPYYKIKYDKNMALLYKEALIKEIHMMSKLYEGKNVQSIYFGGGTPILLLEELTDIMNALKENYNITGDFGIELHPSDINKESLRKLKALGFNMISIGIQSFNEKCLNNLGREYISGEEKVALAKEANFKVIDVDLIFGIKDQSSNNLKDDFRKAFKSGATQVSTYPFIDFSYAKNKNKPLGRRQKKRLLQCLEEARKEIDCERTSVWTFGKKGIPKYSSITRDLYLGFGPSSATLTEDIFQLNTFSVEEYIKCLNKNIQPSALVMKFPKRNRALYWLFWNSYSLKLEKNQFYKLFHENLNDYFKWELKLGLLLKFLKETPEAYELTKKGAYVYHLIEQKYTHEYIDKTWRITGKEPWPKEIKLY